MRGQLVPERIPMPIAPAILCLATLFMGAVVASAAEPKRDVLLEVYYDSGEPLGEKYLEQATSFSGERGGIKVVPRVLTDNPNNIDRLKKIAEHFRLGDEPGPIIYGCNQVIRGVSDDVSIQNRLQSAMRFEVFVRDGCSRCAAAKEVLPSFLSEYPALMLTYRTVNHDTVALNDMNELVRKYKAAAASTPVIHFCNSIQIGFDRSSATTDRLRKAMDRWTVEAPKEESKSVPKNSAGNAKKDSVPEVTSRPPF